MWYWCSLACVKCSNNVSWSEHKNRIIVCWPCKWKTLRRLQLQMDRLCVLHCVWMLSYCVSVLCRGGFSIWNGHLAERKVHYTKDMMAKMNIAVMMVSWKDEWNRRFLHPCNLPYFIVGYFSVLMLSIMTRTNHYLWVWTLPCTAVPKSATQAHSCQWTCLVCLYSRFCQTCVQTCDVRYSLTTGKTHGLFWIYRL